MEKLLLPAVVLGIRPLAVVINWCVTLTLETFGQDYIRTARAKDYLNIKSLENTL
jgi:peptide/nickel transport system permease protein